MVGSYPGQLSSRKRGLHSLGIVTLICYLAETGTRIGEITLVHYFAQGETHSEGRYPGLSPCRKIGTHMRGKLPWSITNFSFSVLSSGAKTGGLHVGV